jgi:hypothetical protein
MPLLASGLHHGQLSSAKHDITLFSSCTLFIFIRNAHPCTRRSRTGSRTCTPRPFRSPRTSQNQRASSAARSCSTSARPPLDPRARSGGSRTHSPTRTRSAPLPRRTGSDGCTRPWRTVAVLVARAPGQAKHRRERAHLTRGAAHHRTRIYMPTHAHMIPHAVSGTIHFISISLAAWLVWCLAQKSPLFARLASEAFAVASFWGSTCA